MDIVLVILFGVAGGFVGGMVGVGGGILFVPALAIFLDQTQVEAEATSLLAIVIVAIAGTIRQRRYGNVRLGDAVVIGAMSVAGVAARRGRIERGVAANARGRLRDRGAGDRGAAGAPGRRPAGRGLGLPSPDSSAPFTPASSAFTR